MRWPPRYCPDCGAPLETASPDATAAECPSCHANHYRNAKPCAGALIERDGRLLLARRGIEPRHGRWDVIGGFLRPDELPHEAARREALEETGLEVSIGDIVGIFIDRYGDDDGDDYTLNIYYRAAPHAGAPSARSDVAELRWFGPNDLPSDLAFAHEALVLEAWQRLPPLV